MAISFMRPDPSSAAAVAAADFSVTRRGYDPEEVRDFLRMVSAELGRLQERERFLEREVQTAVQSAGEAAKQEAAKDAEAELERAREQGRAMVAEAREYREKVLADLARRRELALQQIEQIEQIEQTEPRAPEASARPSSHPSKRSVDEIFARLREAQAAPATRPSSKRSRRGATAPGSRVDAPEASVASTPSPFQRRAEALGPIITAVARQLKRALADDQNECLTILGQSEPTRTLEHLAGSEAGHVRRYTSVVAAELRAAAAAGAEETVASAMASGVVAHVPGDTAPVLADVDDAIVAPALSRLADDLVLQLRDRLERAVTNGDGDRDDLGPFVRSLYREWRQRIDEIAASLCLTAYGDGAYALLAYGTRVTWMGDPDGPPCPDGAPNAAVGPIGAGQAFPTGHLHPPTGEGCRCLVVPVRG